MNVYYRVNSKKLVGVFPPGIFSGCGCPIIPKVGDFVIFRDVKFVVATVTWYIPPIFDETFVEKHEIHIHLEEAPE